MPDTSAPTDLKNIIRPGDGIVWGQSHAQPRTLIRALISQRAELGPLRVFLGIGDRLDDVLASAHADAIAFSAYCGTGSNRMLARDGALDILPSHYSELPSLIESGNLPADVVMLRVSPPDEEGRFSLGMAREYLVPALKRARAIVGEIDPGTPWTFGGPYLAAADFSLLVRTEEPETSEGETAPGLLEQEIGRHVAGLVPDGATLQAGIGRLPDALLGALTAHRNLGAHSGSFGDGMAALAEAGILNNAAKSIDRATSVAGVLIGGARLRRFAHRNPALQMRGTEYTHDPGILASLDRFVALNSAIEVDLTGQINAETAGGTYVGAVGGLLDFVRGARRSRGGLPVVALPSKAGARSRIVSALSGPVTVPRSDACVIVTEYGVADLRGQTLANRVDRMIAISHPDMRDVLDREADTVLGAARTVRPR